MGVADSFQQRVRPWPDSSAASSSKPPPSPVSTSRTPSTTSSVRSAVTTRTWPPTHPALELSVLAHPKARWTSASPATMPAAAPSASSCNFRILRRRPHKTNHFPQPDIRQPHQLQETIYPDESTNFNGVLGNCGIWNVLGYACTCACDIMPPDRGERDAWKSEGGKDTGKLEWRETPTVLGKEKSNL